MGSSGGRLGSILRSSGVHPGVILGSMGGHFGGIGPPRKPNFGGDVPPSGRKPRATPGMVITGNKIERAMLDFCVWGLVRSYGDENQARHTHL